MQLPSNLKPAEFMQLLTPAGQDQVLAIMRQYRDEHGAEWVDYMRDEYPNLSLVVDLVANHTADEALAVITKQYPLAAFAGGQIKTLHAVLRAEVDRKR